jgi:ABC-type multidrug transport system fused ATPase/permease subunit
MSVDAPVRSGADDEGAPVAAPSEPHPTPARGSYFGLLRRYRARMAALAVTATTSGLLEALIIVLIARIAFAVTDDADQVQLVGGRSVDMGVAFALCGVAVVLTIASQVYSAWQSADLGARVIERIRADLSDAFLQATWESQHKERAGRLQELLTTFIRGGAQLISATTRGLVAFCNLVALTIAVVFINAFVAAILLFVALALGAVIGPLRKRVRREAQVTADAGMRLATTLNEVSQLGMEMHVFNVQRQASQRVRTLISENKVTNRRLDFLQQFTPTIYSSTLYVALIAGLGLLTVIGVSDIAALGTVTLIMFRIMRFGQTLQLNWTQISANLPFLEQLDEELERYQAARVSDGGAQISRVGALGLVDVDFEYNPGVPVLTGVNATIDACEVIGIVGPSGSGKSTLVQLLLGLRDPTSGAITADGRDIRTLSRTEWARRVTFVPQQSHLIAGTVADNIRFFRDDISDERIEYAARLANLHEDVMNWEDGYQRDVGEKGGHLSGGQQQRLVIARALVEQPDVLILDEPTSALDVRSEFLIRQALESLRERMTVIIIAHRLSTLENCDRIMVVMDGEVKAFDAPDRLAKTNEFYREALEMSGVR